MPFRQSIASKIFGLAIFLLLLTIALAGFLLWHVTQLEKDLLFLTNGALPLEDSLSRLHEFGLRRRLAFERWFGALNADRPNEEIIGEARRNYALHTERLMAEIANAKRLLALVSDTGQAHATVGEVRELLTQVENAYPLISARQERVLSLQQGGERARAAEQLTALNDLQRLVQTQREELQQKTARLAEAAADAAVRTQREVIVLTVAATVSTVLLGLTVAALVTNWLVRPVRALISAVREVQQGRVDLQLPVRSSDEVGVLTSSFNFLVREMRSKEAIKETFGRYMDPRILERVLLAPTTAEAEGGRRVMTVLFADLVGFTGLSERLTPTLMVRVLNRHFGLQAHAVQEHQGVVDKFIGDSIMAFWGPPFVGSTEHATLACRAALAQLAALDTLRGELAEITGLRRDAPEIDLRIGICSGDVVVGNIGSANARSYTVIGDTVNLASRLETANRTYGTRILAAETTVRDLGEDIETREIDAVRVKGKTEPMRIFELLGLTGQVPAARLKVRERFAAGLAAYRGGDWSAAQAALAECLSLEPADGPSQVFTGRVAILRERPAGESWDGVWEMTSK